MDRRVTSPTLGPPPPCKQALTQKNYISSLKSENSHSESKGLNKILNEEIMLVPATR